MSGTAEQHTLDWYRARLGNITGSSVGLLMKSGRKKDELFSETGKTYLYQVAAERDMNPAITDDDTMFEVYLQQVNVTSKAMQWGTDQEADARDLYVAIRGIEVSETGLCAHPSIPHFASSPDGLCVDDDGVKGCIEIKCPNQSTFMKYRCEVIDNETLLDAKYEYFYQCMAHMMCTGASWCDFIVYSPFQEDPIHIVRILPDKDVFDEMERKIRAADDLIEEIR